jgi:anti-sigma factor RsiW
MSAHLSDEQIRSFRDRSLASADLLRVSSHIADCEVCRARIASPQELRNQINRLRSVIRAESAVPLHISYEDIAAHVDDQLDESEAEGVAQHARECEACAANIAELRTLKQNLENRRTSGGRSNWLGDFRHSMLSWRGGLALAGSVALAIVVVAVALEPWRRHEANPRQDSGPALAKATIRDGKRVLTLTAGGAVFGLESLSPDDRATVEQAVAAKAIDAPELIAQLGGKRELLLGSADATPPLELLAPLATVVESERPVFRWKALAAAQYQANVYDASYKMIEASGWIRQTEWQPTQPLRRGARYSWQVEVRRNGTDFTVPVPPMPEARFQVLDAAGEGRITRMRSEWADSHLVLGVTYAKLGLLDDAARELSELDEQNPGSSTTAGLRASVDRLRDANPGPRQSQ